MEIVFNSFRNKTKLFFLYDNCAYTRSLFIGCKSISNTIESKVINTESLIYQLGVFKSEMIDAKLNIDELDYKNYDYYNVDGKQLEYYIKNVYEKIDIDSYVKHKIIRAIEYVYRLGKNTVGDIKKQYIRDLECAIWELKQITGGSNE